MSKQSKFATVDEAISACSDPARARSYCDTEWKGMSGAALASVIRERAKPPNLNPVAADIAAHLL